VSGGLKVSIFHWLFIDLNDWWGENNKFSLILVSGGLKVSKEQQS